MAHPSFLGILFTTHQIGVLRRKATVLTEVNDNKAAHAEEPVHRVQSPLDDLLQIWCDESHDEIEEPVRCGRQGYTLRPDSKRHDLWRVEPRNRPPAV